MRAFNRDGNTSRYVGAFAIGGDGEIRTFPLLDIEAVKAATVNERELSRATPL